MAWGITPASALTRSSIQGAVWPISSAPSAVPQAFSGIGLTAGLGIYPLGKTGFGIRYVRSGTASVFTITAIHYLLGEPLSLTREAPMASLEKKNEPLTLRARSWGLFLEGGLAYYSATKLSYSEGESKVLIGFAPIVAIGAEYPILESFSALSRIGTIQSLGGQINTIFLEIGASFGFSI